MTSKLAAMRLTSHSQGPGTLVEVVDVEDHLAFGGAEQPEIREIASPQSWTVIPESGEEAKSSAMIKATRHRR